jgi:hypothetical protein
MKINDQELLEIMTTKEYRVEVKAGRLTIQDPMSKKILDITEELENTGHFNGGKLENVYICTEGN